MSLFSIVSALLIGAGLAWIPWTPLWETNAFLRIGSSLRGLLLNGHFRGAVSGVGLVNIILAIDELIRFMHYAGERRR
jgi:hypothetical protein